LCDARRFASVLPDRDFVQMAETTPIKFKSSVAGTLHPAAGKGPKLEQVNKSFGNLTRLERFPDTPWPWQASVCR
jgi:hypothetical protein